MKAPTHLLPCAWIRFSSHLCISFYSPGVVYFPCVGCSILPTREQSTCGLLNTHTKFLNISADLPGRDCTVHCVNDEGQNGDHAHVTFHFRGLIFPENFFYTRIHLKLINLKITSRMINGIFWVHVALICHSSSYFHQLKSAKMLVSQCLSFRLSSCNKSIAAEWIFILFVYSLSFLFLTEDSV